MVTISSYSDTATTNGEVSAGQSSTMKPDLDAGGGGGQASTDFFDMVPSTGVCYISVNMCLLLCDITTSPPNTTMKGMLRMKR